MAMKINIKHNLTTSLQSTNQIFNQQHFRENLAVIRCKLTIQIFSRNRSTSIAKHNTIWINHGDNEKVDFFK